MLIVGIDTSGKNGGLALARGDADTCEVFEETPIAGGTFSAQLVPQLAALLAKHGFRKEDLNGIACASGPGSFTGLRVGLAAVKALAEILHIPIAAISVLEALAIVSGEHDVVAGLDAGRGEFYVGTYGVERGRATLIDREALVTADELQVRTSAVLVTPAAKLADALRSRGVQVRVLDRPGAAAIASVGLRRIAAGETVSPEQLDANYIRRSDAEIFAKK
jgi:tRNA threonylcarbamoyladenosine biosynthesis protein TsaB